MARYWVNTELTTGDDSGLSPANAWRSANAMQTAIQYASLAAGDIVTFTRNCYFTGATSNIVPSSSVEGTVNNPIQYRCWARGTVTGTITFTRGSRVLSGCSITPNHYYHACRYIRNDSDAKDYMITAVAHKIDFDAQTANFTNELLVTGGTSGAIGKIHRIVDDGETGSLWIVVRSGTFQDDETITDSNGGSATVNGTPANDGFIIRRKYAGASATSAAFTIAADPWYSEDQALDDTEWPTGFKKTDLDAQSHALPYMDFTNTAYQLYPNGSYNAQIAKQVEICGYRYAVTTEKGLNSRSDSMMCLRRPSSPESGTCFDILRGCCWRPVKDLVKSKMKGRIWT